MVASLLAAVETAPEVAGSANLVTENAWIIPALFFAATAVIVLFGKRLPGKGSSVGIGAAAIAFVLSIVTLTDFIGGGGPNVRKVAEWFPFGDGLGVGIGIKITGLTAIMLVVVTAVSLLVQIFSSSYMHDDKRYTWYFAALNLFTASMLNLVVAPNLIQLLIGWELVGVCSYLLIGHWWEERPNSNAAMKAFITTRIGDVPFAIGIFVLFAAAGTFSIDGILEAVEAGGVSSTALTAAAVLLFGGAMGKSAQFPLHVWLPDAMAGPTPVSALIHAATMVTAGVFLIARLFPVFEAAPAGLNEIAIIGMITMLMAALIAMVQDDIKKVLAYSTISQLAYMFAALGVGAGNAAVFHLFTHAWFKALLFLGAGSVIHAVHSNNMSEMGGLRKYMPHTFKTFLIGSIALAGIPPLAGFFSKDEILAEAYHFATHPDLAVGSPGVAMAVFVVGIITALLTAFYMTRTVYLTFFGTYRGHGKPHESPALMTGPLWVLAGLSIGAGFVGFPGWQQGFGAWVAVGGHTHVPAINWALAGFSVAVAVAGIALGRALYRTAPARDPLLRLGGFHTLLENKFYLDDIYYKGLVYPIRDRLSAALYWINQNLLDGAVNGAAGGAKMLGRGMYTIVDQKVIDGAVNGAGMGTRGSGGLLKYLQSGNVQRYAAILFAGVAVMAFLFTRF